MSEEPNAGPIGGGDPGSGGEPSGTPESTGSPTTFTRDTLLQSLPEDIRGEAVFQNLNAENPIQDMANQFLHSQKMVGQDRMPAPQENWGDDQWNAFWDKAGRPETADAYGVPEVEGIVWDPDQLTSMKDFAHQQGVPAKHFEAMLQKYAEMEVGKQTASDTQLQETVNNQLTSLKTELAKEGKDYDAVVQLANEGLQSFEDESLVQLFTENPILANHPSIVKTFASLAEQRRESLARNAGSGKINSQMDAKAALNAFEAKHAEIIHAEPEKLSWADRERREVILKERTDIYQLAFPQESA